MSNRNIGDSIPNYSEDETIIFHNINGLKDENNWCQILQTMQDLNADTFGMVEINRSLQNQLRHQWKNTTKKFFNFNRLIHTESKMKFDQIFKPGGTMQITTGKWQARITEQGCDNRGLGRWTFQRISSTKSNLVIVTAYRPCVTHGPTTAWIQQWTLLREEGRTNPDPVKIFYQDLTAQLDQWTQKGYEIILMLDANETIGEKPGGLNSMIRQAKLTDLILYKHPTLQQTNTYARGTKQIDYILGTKRVRDWCSAAGMLPFGTGYPSDHRQLFIQVNIASILNTKINPLESGANRKIQNATPKERKTFIDATHFYFAQQNLFDRLQALMDTQPDQWSPSQVKEYESCDKQHIEGMLYAENTTKKIKTTPWSPTFQKVTADKSFWKIALTLKMNHIYPSEDYLKWAESKGIQDFKGLDITTVKTNLRKAQKAVREVTKQAAKLREIHLQSMLTEAEINDENQQERRLKILLRAHKQQQIFKRLRNMFKPSASGGLSYILVPTNFKRTNSHMIRRKLKHGNRYMIRS
jgi:hypothetical protein